VTFSSDPMATTTNMFRLGITQHLIRSGIARLEEIRDDSGALIDLYVRVSETSGMYHEMS